MLSLLIKLIFCFQWMEMLGRPEDFRRVQATRDNLNFMYATWRESIALNVSIPTVTELSARLVEPLSVH